MVVEWNEWVRDKPCAQDVVCCVEGSRSQEKQECSPPPSHPPQSTKLNATPLTLNRASVGIYACTVLYCTVLHCTVLYSTVQSLTFPQIPCVRLCENFMVLGLV